MNLLTNKDFANRNPEVVHFVTTREGGFSPKPFNSLNFGQWSGDSIENVTKNKGLLCEKLEIKATELYIPREVHKTESIIIDSKFKSLEKTYQKEALSISDALITNKNEICVGITTADCVPVLLYDKNNHIVAAIHAGWRGIVGEIISKTIEHLKQICTTDNDLQFVIGPCIDGNNYEVDYDVWENFEHTFNSSEQNQILKFKKGSKYYPDIYTAAYLQIKRFTSTQNIYFIKQNTYTSNELYSVRRDGQKTGRFLSGIFMKTLK